MSVICGLEVTKIRQSGNERIGGTRVGDVKRRKEQHRGEED